MSQGGGGRGSDTGRLARRKYLQGTPWCGLLARSCRPGPTRPGRQPHPAGWRHPMEQKYEGSPRAEIRLEGRRVTRGEVANDWGLRLQWEVRRDGKVIATPAARAETSYEHADATPGTYQVVLQMWKY